MMDGLFTEKSFTIPEGAVAEYFAIDYCGRRVAVKEINQCYGCRYYVDAADCVEFVVQGIIALSKLLVVALPSSNDNPYRVGKLGGATAVFLPSRVVKYPKVLPPNTTFKQMISGLQDKLLQELRADLDRVDNCPPTSPFPNPQQLEVDVCDDWKAIPAHLFEYGYESDAPEGFIDFFEKNARMIIPPGCEPTYFIKDRFFESATVDGPAGAWGCYYFVDSDHFSQKVLQGIIKICKGVIVFATNDKPYRVAKRGSDTVIFIPARVYPYPNVLPPNTTYKQMMLGMEKQECDALRADLARVNHNFPNLTVPDVSLALEARFSEEDWEEMRALDGYAPENKQGLPLVFQTGLALCQGEAFDTTVVAELLGREHDHLMDKSQE